MFVLASTPQWLVLVAIIAAFAAISIVSFVIYRLLHPKLKGEDDRPNEEQIVQENLDRFLKPVEDEETAKQISEYKDEE